ncbi:hypothetical protein V8C44DRAFT_327533 [Trichoderma aethiopicum]
MFCGASRMCPYVIPVLISGGWLAWARAVTGRLAGDGALSGMDRNCSNTTCLHKARHHLQPLATPSHLYLTGTAGVRVAAR